jgi:two-component system chemotaxis response regulator CheB
LTRLLQRSTDLPVRTARDGQPILGPGMLVLPRGHTGTLEAGYQLRLHEQARVVGGGDELLSSAAQVARERLIGVVLTGMLADGANGVRAVKRHGGRVLVEDPHTARAGGMPSHAIATGCVDFALPQQRIAAALTALVLAPGGAELFSVPTPAWATLQV